MYITIPTFEADTDHKMGSIQVPEVQRIHRDHVDEIIQAIKDDGGCIVKNFASEEAVEQVNADTLPYLEADGAWEVRDTFSKLINTLTK